MKKLTLFLLLLLSACATTKHLPNNSQVLAGHTAPLKIFGIGRYGPGSMILTLTDADDHYFMIEAPADTNFKIGGAYP